MNRLKEELRLFYVAVTRASYSLHLTIKSSKDTRKTVFTGAKKFLDYIPKDFNLDTYTIDQIDREQVAKQKIQVLFGTPNQEIVDKIKGSLSYSYPRLEDTRLPLKNSVTGAMLPTDEDAPYTYVLFDEQEGTTNTERGNVAHKIMEHLDFSRRDEFTKQVNEMVDKGIVSLEDIKSVNLERIKNAVSNKEFDGLENAELYPEQGFIVGIEGKEIFDTQSTEQALLQGIIDLLAIDGDKAYIIDYKYSSRTKESLERKYQKQLKLYAYAVEKTLGKKVVKKLLVNLFTGELVEID